MLVDVGYQLAPRIWEAVWVKTEQPLMVWLVYQVASSPVKRELSGE